MKRLACSSESKLFGPHVASRFDGTGTSFNLRVEEQMLRKRFYRLVDSWETYRVQPPAQSHAIAFLNAPIVKEIGQKFGHDMSLSGFRLRDSNTLSNDPEYFEIQLEPNLLLPNKILMATMIYRSEKLSDVVGKCVDLAGKVESLLSQITSS